MEMGEFDKLFEALRRACADAEVSALKALYAQPSSLGRTLNDVKGNAVLIDGSGRTREFYMPDIRHEYLIPIPQKFQCVFLGDTPPAAPGPIPIARFVLSSVQDGRAVYRFAGMR